MLTARSQESDKAIGEETGADEYITKPFEFNDVLEIMQKIYRLKFMDLVTNKTIDKLKYDLVRNNIITFEDIEKAQEMAKCAKYKSRSGFNKHRDDNRTGAFKIFRRKASYTVS